MKPTLMTGTAQAKNFHWTLLFLSWLIAMVSTLGALFLSEVMGMAPCVLCWYPRVAMFPLVIILALGLLHFDYRSVRYALPLAVTGWAIALYHCSTRDAERTMLSWRRISERRTGVRMKLFERSAFVPAHYKPASPFSLESSLLYFIV